MINVVTGYNGPGGSTVALTNLVNLFNDNGMEATLVCSKNNRWEGITCRVTDSVVPSYKQGILIYHFTQIPENVARAFKKVILSCHETTLMPIKKMVLNYDSIHFVSEFQKKWQGVDGVVIPNVISNIEKNPHKEKKVAGVIGSIDRNKRTRISIENALRDGFSEIRLYGHISDREYYNAHISPLLLTGKVFYCGQQIDKTKMYWELTDVYHSPELETYNMVKPECLKAGVNYHGEEGNDTEAEYWDNERILLEWKKLLSF